MENKYKSQMQANGEQISSYSFFKQSSLQIDDDLDDAYDLDNLYTRDTNVLIVDLDNYGQDKLLEFLRKALDDDTGGDLRLLRKVRKILDNTMRTEYELLDAMNFKRKQHPTLTFDYKYEKDYMNSKLVDEDVVVKIIDYIVNPSILRKSYTICKGLQNNFKKIAGNEQMLRRI